MKDTKFRMEMSAEGMSVIYLLDSEARTMYMYYPDQNMAMAVPYDEPSDSAVDEAESVLEYSPVVVGHETKFEVGLLKALGFSTSDVIQVRIVESLVLESGL